MFGAENDYFWWFRPFLFSAKTAIFVFVFSFSAENCISADSKSNFRDSK